MLSCETFIATRENAMEKKPMWVGAKRHKQLKSLAAKFDKKIYDVTNEALAEGLPAVLIKYKNQKGTK